jgi:hypothetical protein
MSRTTQRKSVPLCGDSDLNLDTSLNVDDDLLDRLGGRIQTISDRH